MNNFEMLSNRSFGAQVAAMIKTGPMQVWQFWNLVFNAIARTYETNDVSHINKMIAASLAVGRFKTFSAVVPGLVPFKFDKAGRLFGGKLRTGTANKMLADGQAGELVWIELLKSYIAISQDDAAKAVAKDYSIDAAALAFVRKAEGKGNLKIAAILKAVEKADAEIKAAA